MAPPPISLPATETDPAHTLSPFIRGFCWITRAKLGYHRLTGWLRLLPQLLQGPFDRIHHIQKSLVDVGPHRDRSSICRRRQKLSEWQVMPVARPQDDRNDARLTLTVPLQSSLHLPFVAVIGCDEVWTNQQKHDIRCVDMAIDRLTDVRARRNAAIAPRSEEH